LAAQGYARAIALEAPYLSAGVILTQSDMVAGDVPADVENVR